VQWQCPLTTTAYRLPSHGALTHDEQQAAPLTVSCLLPVVH
jgi:hypothetical protein